MQTPPPGDALASAAVQCGPVLTSHTCWPLCQESCKRAPSETRLHERRCSVWSCFNLSHFLSVNIIAISGFFRWGELVG